MVIEFIWLLKWLLKYITNYITSYKSQVPVIHLQKWSPYLRYHTNYIPALVASSQGRFVFKHDYNFKTQFACQVALCLKELVEFRKALLNRKQLYSIYCRDNENETPRITNKLRCEKVLGFPWWLVGKESTCQCRRWGLISGLERSLGEGNGNPL